MEIHQERIFRKLGGILVTGFESQGKLSIFPITMLKSLILEGFYLTRETLSNNLCVIVQIKLKKTMEL